MSIAKRVVMVVAMALVVGNVWGADKTTTWTATSGGLGSGIGSGTIYTTVSGTSAKQAWTYTRTLISGESYSGWSSNCIQLGKNGGVENLTLTTSNILGTIKSVSVECSSHSAQHKVSITVGGTTYLKPTPTADWTTVNAKSGTGTSSGTITISFTGGDRALYIKSISVIYTPPAYTVTFDAGGGTFDDPSSLETGNKLTESSSGAGVILPATSPSIACSYEEWSLYGWATTSCSSSTTTTPAIVGKAGDRYYPGTNETLYAVYAKGEFTKETSSITPGSKYLIVANSGGKNYIMKSSSADFREDGEGYYGMETAQINETSAGKYNIKDVDGTWCYTIEGTAGAYYIRDVVNSSSKNYADIYSDQWWGNSKTTSNSYSITESDGVWSIKSNRQDNLYLDFYEEDAAFYALNEALGVLLYKETEPATYFSNPECCETAPVIGGTAQLKAGGTYSLTRVDVECTSATVQDNCEWTDYGFIWSESVNTTTTLQLNSDGSAPSGVTKVQVGTSGDASSFNGSLEKSSFETGHTYYYRAYVKNCYYDGSYVYSNTSTLASFTPYTISYNNNGGTGSIAPQIVNTGGSVTLSDGTGFAAPTGYHFDHWALNSTSGSSYDASDSYSSITADATFYAIWAINSHTLAWNFTGGSSSETEGTHYTAAGTKDYGTALSYPSSGSMNRTGYTFAGWSTDASTMPDNDLTITASWNTISYDVTYHLNGGSGASDRTYTIETANITLPTPTKTGYTFGGWYDNSSCTGEEVSSITVGSTGNREYWAKWTANSYAVAFDKNGGEGEMANQNFTYDAPEKALSKNTYTPATGSHKYFAGWATTSDGTVEYADQAEVRNLKTSGTYTLYAVWKAHTYTNYRTTCITRYDITLDDGEVAKTNNGSAQVSENGTKLAKMVAPTKAGYTLKGYYTAKSGGEKIADLEGVLQADVSVSETEWTNSDGQWVKGGDATFYAQWDVNTYDITLNREGAEDGDESVTLTYNSNSHDAITNPSKVGYTFSGWYSGIGGTGTLVIDASGVLQNSVTIETVNWTDASGNWIKDGTATLYAKWTVIQTTLSFNQNSGEGGQTSNLTATYAATMPAINGTPTRAGYYFGGYYDGEGGTGTQYYTAAGTSARSWDKDNASLTLYARWYGDLKAWCDPDVEVTGDVHLTSYNGISVNSTSAAGNLIEISSSDMGSATKMEVAYLNADAADAEVDKDESVFRFCNNGTTNYNVADENAIDLDYEWGTSHSIKYTPNAYDQRDNYKLQLTFKHGDKVLKTVTHAIYGRALPEEFVIASKYLGHWYALPNTMGTSAEAVTPILITVDNASAPTEASYAPSTTVYKGAARYRPGNNVNAIRFTSTSSNWLETSATAQLKLSTTATPTEGVENKQVFYLNSSTFGVYELANSGKKLGMYSGNMGMYADPAYTSEDIYLLPITNKYTPVDATATDWTGDAIGVTASTSATKMGIAQEDGTETDPVTLSSSGTSHAADFDGDIDFTGLKDKTLWLTWYDGSDNLIGGSQVTVPSIVLAGANDEWSNFASAPTLSDIVVLSKPMTIDKVAQAKQIVIDQSGSNTGKLVINADQSLIVDGKISKFADGAFGGTSASDLAILSSSSGTGALITGERSTTTQATVGFYTQAIKHETRGYVNQYIGIPFSGITAYDRFYDTYVYEYIASSNAWSPLTNNGEMSPYTAYNLMRDEDTETTLYSGGTLVLPGTAAEYKDHDLTLTLRNASATTTNMFANPYTAPIDITAMVTGDFTGVDATIYLFNSGSKDDVDKRAAQAGSGAGQWLVLPVTSVAAAPGSYAVTTIPSQQAFMVKGNSDNATHKVTIDYKKHVYDPAKTSGATINPARAPKRVSEETTLETMSLTVQGLGGASDRVLMFMREDFSIGFDNGWDGRKMKGKTYAPYLYAATDDGKMAVNSIPTAEGTVLGFKAGTEDNYYTFSFEYDGEDNWYLNDLKEQKSTLIHAAETYEFVAEPGDTEARFVISATPIHKIATGNESAGAEAAKVRKLIIDDKIYIIRGGRMYSVDGQMIK